MKLLLSKYVISRAVAVLTAIIISYYFARAEYFWLVMAAIIVMQTAIGVPLRQGIKKFFIVSFSVTCGTLFVILIHQNLILYATLLIILSVCSYFIKKNDLKFLIFNTPVLISIILIISLLVPADNLQVLYARLSDITIGSFIGILANLLIFPRRVDVEFRKNLIPLLNAYSEYFSSIVEYLFKNNNAKETVNKKQLQVEKAQAMFFPEWVYEAGLSVTLRPGHRHFLVMIERLSQILFSMHYAVHHQFDDDFLSDFKEVLKIYVDEVSKIFHALTLVLNLNKINEGVSDLADEVDQIEKKFQNYSALELLDISKDYIYFAAFLADLKDMRKTLLALMIALRSRP